MAESWEMSFLIDQATKIHEARGNFGKHIGKPLRGLIGDHLVNFVAQEDRLRFLRFMARLIVRTGGNTATARMKTPMLGEKIFALDARQGSRPKTWWMMLSSTNIEGYAPLSSVVSGDPVATRDEFGHLARSVARESGGKSGVTLFESRAVSSPEFGKLTKERREELDKKIEGALLGATSTGIVTKPEAGYYAVVHGANELPEQISERIVSAASEMNVTAQELGLSRTTSSLDPDIEAEDIVAMIRDMREKIAARAAEPDEGAVSYGAVEEKKQSLVRTFMSKLTK